MKKFEEFEPMLEFEQEVISKIIHEGERMLDAQLNVATAADQRALSYLGFLSAVVTAAISAVIYISVSQKELMFLCLVASVYSAMNLFSIFQITDSLRSRKFSYPGNLPENWLPHEWNFSLPNQRTKKHAMIEQCFCLNQAISKNKEDIEKNSEKFNLGLDCSICAALSASSILAIYVFRIYFPICYPM